MLRQWSPQSEGPKTSPVRHQAHKWLSRNNQHWIYATLCKRLARFQSLVSCLHRKHLKASQICILILLQTQNALPQMENSFKTLDKTKNNYFSLKCWIRWKDYFTLCLCVYVFYALYRASRMEHYLCGMHLPMSCISNWSLIRLHFLCCSVSFEKQLVCIVCFYLKVLLMSCVCVYEILLLNKCTLCKWVYLVLKSNAGSMVMEAIRTTCLISRAIILSFSKFTRPSTLELLPASTGLTDSYYIFKPNSKFLGNRNRERCKLPSWRNVRSFLMTGNRGMTGGCRLCLLRRLRYLAILREGSKTSCNSARSFSYFPGNRSHVDLNRATGARLNPLQKIHRYRDGLFEW